MEHMPHLVIEGMIIAGWSPARARHLLHPPRVRAAGAHPAARDRALLRARGMLGANILGTRLAFDLEIFVSPGGYICGEETRAARGDRRQARRAAQQAAVSRCTQGLWDKPTVINNVETFANVPQILVRGVDWYKAQGQAARRAEVRRRQRRRARTRGFSKCRWARRCSEVIFRLRRRHRATGQELKAFAPSGPSSGYLPASMVDVRLDFKSLARCRVHARLGRDRGLRRRPLHAGHGAERACASSATNRAASACRAASARRRWWTCSTGWTQGKGTAADLALVDELSRRAEADLHLRPGPVRPVADRVGAEAFPRRGRGAHLRSSAARPACARMPDRRCRMSEQFSSRSTAATVSVPRRHDGLRRRADERHRDPDAVPPAERDARRRLPRVRRGVGARVLPRPACGPPRTA